MVAAAAEQRAAAEVQTLRTALDRANAQKRQALAELDTLSREHSELQHAYARQGLAGRAPTGVRVAAGVVWLSQH
jgi:hypothetical protein